MDISSEFLVESKSAREQGIDKLKVQRSEESILNKVKQLFFAVWKGVGRVTRDQLAEFYEVSTSTIDSNYQRHNDEFESDGVKVFDGNDLKDARRIMRLPSTSSKQTIYTAAGALRMGFILRDSEVAKTVRTVAIRFIQGIGEQIDSQDVLQGLTKSYPVLDEFVVNKAVKVSAPLSPYWEKMKFTLAKTYPYGGIVENSKSSGMTTDDIRKTIQFLSTYTDRFKLQGIKEFRFELASQMKGKYPSLTSDILNFDMVNESGSAVIMFQFDNLIIDSDYVEECVGRNYIQLAKEYLGVDRAYLIFVAPFGATSYAEDYIKRRLLSENHGYVGVLTVKDLARFLYNQAISSRKLGTAKGEISKEFNQLLNYQFPDPPVMVEQQNLFDLIEQQ